MTRLFSRISIILVSVLLVSCSSRGAELIATAPGLADNLTHGGVGNQVLWGIWDVSINPVSMSATVTPKRNADFACNVTRFLQPPIASKNLVTVDIDPFSDFVKGLVSADITLTHPFPGMDFYTGFDVRGVVIGNGSVGGVDDPGVIYGGQNDLQLLNADGLTRWFNPTEFTTYGKLFGFTQGSKGTPSYDFTATLNGYRYFCDNLDKDIPAVEFFADPSCLNLRGCFHAGGSLTRRYELQFPMESGKPNFHFQYAIVASWLPSTPQPPKNVPDDFPISANCAEAYALSALDLSEMHFVSDSEKGGNLALMVRVFDHQGVTDPLGVPGEIKSIMLETPSGLLDGNIATFESAALDSCFLGKDENSATWLLQVPNTHPPSAGLYPVLVAVESAAPNTYDSGITGFAFPAGARLASYLLTSVSVDNDFGWARTWGGVLDDGYTNVAVDAPGNSYISGNFGGTVDFDPGPGTDFHTVNGTNPAYSDIFLSKFDSNGVFQWARTWGGDLWDSAHAISTDSAGNTYVVGLFFETVDFDPGPGVCDRTSNGYSDIFVSKFDTNGNFLWVAAWGGDSEECDYGENIWVDSLGDVYVTGKTPGTVDFDPGPGVDFHTSNGALDFFLSKFDASGNFIWARTWGSPYNEGAWGVVSDASGNPYVTGWFLDTADFDPGPDVDNHTSNGQTDCFLSKFDALGNLLWARTWGGLELDMSKWIAVNDSGNVYASGFFSNTADFDPGPGVQMHTSNGMGDVFLMGFSPDGDFLWASTMGGPLDDCSDCMAVSQKGDICITGRFKDSVDFDPGPGADIHNSQGDVDIFLGKFSSSGDFEWAETWGGVGTDQGGGVAFNSSGSIFINAAFADTIDFDPGAAVDNHTSIGGTDILLMKLMPDGTW